MPAPTTTTALERVFDLLEHALKRINHDNGFRTHGVLIDRAKDPRAVRENLPEQYEQFQCALTLVRARRKLDRAKSIGRHVWDCYIDVLGLRTMTRAEDDAGRTLDELAADLQDDLRLAIWQFTAPEGTQGVPIGAPGNFVKIAAQLGIVPPTITGVVLDEVIDDEGVNFPDSHFVGVVYFRMEERFGF